MQAVLCWKVGAWGCTNGVFLIELGLLGRSHASRLTLGLGRSRDPSGLVESETSTRHTTVSVDTGRGSAPGFSQFAAGERETGCSFLDECRQ